MLIDIELRERRANDLVKWHDERIRHVNDVRVRRPYAYTRTGRVLPNSLFALELCVGPHAETLTLLMCVDRWMVNIDGALLKFTAVPCIVCDGRDQRAIAVEGDSLSFCANRVSDNWVICDPRFVRANYTLNWTPATR